MSGKVPKELQEDTELKEFTIKGDGYEYMFKYQPLTWYQEEKIINDISDINPATRKMTINIPELNMQIMLQTLKEAPFDILRDNLMSLKSEIKDKIMEVVSPKKSVEELEKKLVGQ